MDSTDLPQRLAAIASANLPALVQAAQLAARGQAVTRSYAESELTELVRGFVAVLAETARAGEQGDVRKAFLETAVPALVEQGEKGSELVFGSVLFGVLMSRTLVRLLPPAEQEEGTVFVARFLGGYVRDLHLQLTRGSR